MEKNNGESLPALNDDEWKDLIKKVDQETESPDVRAQYILRIVRGYDNITTYDIWCFSIYMLQTLMAEYTIVTPVVKVLHKLLYQLHYRLQIWRQIPNGLPRNMAVSRESSETIRTTG